MSTQLENKPTTVEPPVLDAQDRFLLKHPKLKDFTDKHPEIYKIIKFFIAGAIANVPEILVYILFLDVILVSLQSVSLPDFAIFNFMRDSLNFEFEKGIADMYAFMISTAVGYAVAFVLNRKISFKADANVALSTFLYAFMVIFTIGANSVIGPILRDGIAKTGMPGTLVNIISKFLGMAIPGLWTYPCNRFIIHRQRKPKGEAGS